MNTTTRTFLLTLNARALPPEPVLLTITRTLSVTQHAGDTYSFELDGERVTLERAYALTRWADTDGSR